MTTTKTYAGTCAWCFRPFVVDGEHPVRHGWREAGGTRRAGEYGNVFHTGNCNGTHYPVYEISPKGTIARLKLVREYLAGCEEKLAELATRPVLYQENRYTISYRNYRPIHVEYGFRIADGERFTIEVGKFDRRTYEYEYLLKRRIKEAEDYRAALKADIEFCQKAIDEWTVKPLAEHDPAARTMHFAPTERQKKYRQQTYCGQKGYYAATTENEAEVTCTRCRKALDGEAAKKKKQETAANDGETITAFIREHGPITPKEIKAALDWDQGRLTKAIEKGAENLARGRKKPTRWEYLPEITDPTQKAVLEAMARHKMWFPERGDGTPGTGLAGLTVQETNLILTKLARRGWVEEHAGGKPIRGTEFKTKRCWGYKDELRR